MIRLRKVLLCNYLYISLAVISLVYSFYMLNIKHYESKYNINDNVIKGYIDKLKIDGDHVSILLVGKEKVIVNYYFKTEKEKKSFNLKLGCYIKIIGEIKIPKKASVFNLFDYQKYLYRNNIYYTFTAKKIENLNASISIHYRIKQILTDYIDKIGKSSSYIKALVIGNDDEFNREVNESYQINGVSHLFAISGSHITFLSVIILWLLKKIKIEENKRYYLVIMFLLFYSFLTDYAGSVLRSVAFFILLSINKMYYFNIKTINILLLTLFFLLFIKPNLLYDVGFQFSFIISFYLILMQSFISKAKNYFKMTLIISLISFLVSIPICINNFFQINLLSPIFNVIFVPYVSFILFPLSFISLILPFIDKILFIFIKILEYISLLFSKIKISQIVLSKPSFLIILLYYILINLSIYGLVRKKYYLFIPLIIVISIHYNINSFNRDVKVTFLDVGQGDSIFINLPYNKGNILIDTGGKLESKEPWQKGNSNYSISSNVIIPYLKSIGIHKLDYLFLTHGDYDHMGESINLINHFNVSKVILNDGKLVDLEKSLIKDLKGKKISYSFGKTGDVITIDQYKFSILNPSSDTNENDNSLVIYTKLKNYSFLFTGDASTKMEKEIIDAYPNLKVDILKLGHHGSITSTSEVFLDTLKPTYGVIEVGLNNRFNHPDKKVIERLEKRNIKIFQTSLNGSVLFNIGTNDITIINALS